MCNVQSTQGSCQHTLAFVASMLSLLVSAILAFGMACSPTLGSEGESSHLAGDSGSTVNRNRCR